MSLDSEIKVLRNLSHRSIVRYFGMEVLKSKMHTFMEYMPGVRFMKVILYIMRSSADASLFAARLHVVHYEWIDCNFNDH